MKKPFVIKLSISPWRRKKGIELPAKPIKRSEYAQLLFDEGAGFDGQKTD